MGKNTGAKIKEARAAAKLTQEQLAKEVGSITASDISKAERGEAELSQAVLKKIAKATGVTQASLLNAEKDTAKKTTAKTAAAKTTAKKTESKTASKDASMKLTETEQKLVKLYRKADKDTKEQAMKVLSGEQSEIMQLIMSMYGDKIQKILGGK